jgi:hypothetical protein
MARRAETRREQRDMADAARERGTKNTRGPHIRCTARREAGAGRNEMRCRHARGPRRSDVGEDGG